MYSAVDKLAGRGVVVVYDAPFLPVAPEAGWWERSREVAEFLREEKAKSALGVGPRGGEVWRAGDRAGVSVAAAIEAWIEADAAHLPERATVVLPLDERIYVAEVQDGEVASELVAIPDRAMEAVREAIAERRAVHVFEGGAQAAALAEVAVSAPWGDFDPMRFRYQAPALALLRHGLYHSAALAAPALLAMAAAVPLMEGGSADRGVQAVRAQVAARLDVHARSAGPQLAAVATWLVGQRATALYADGWHRLEVVGWEARLRGAGDGYPRGAESVAVTLGGEFKFAPSGWEILVNAGNEYEELPVEYGHRELLEVVYAAGLRIGGKVTLIATLDRADTRESQVQIEIPQPGAAHLVALGSALDGLPATVASATCDFGKWIAERCNVTLMLKGESG